MIFNLNSKKRLQQSDEEILDEFRSTGDLKILGDLYTPYMNLVYGVCLKYLRDRDEAMDAVMQIFEKLVIEIPRHDIKNFKSWLHVLTKNYCLMQIRSDKSKKENLEEWINSTEFFMENEAGVHPIDEADENMELRLLRCIEKLKGEQKQCIEHFYFGNMSYEDIAASLAVDEKKVKSSLQNAKRNLKICLELNNEEER
ncbi:MAG TPA: sigma-70 family RNA polymerase sigma factor [Bacteroidales bacterium]|nr:sigma-70 family RNA polymerase sigma factor [Bacteroidales bacterium]